MDIKRIVNSREKAQLSIYKHRKIFNALEETLCREFLNRVREKYIGATFFKDHHQYKFYNFWISPAYYNGLSSHNRTLTAFCVLTDPKKYSYKKSIKDILKEVDKRVGIETTYVRLSNHDTTLWFKSRWSITDGDFDDMKTNLEI